MWSWLNEWEEECPYGRSFLLGIYEEVWEKHVGISESHLRSLEMHIETRKAHVRTKKLHEEHIGSKVASGFYLEETRILNAFQNGSGKRFHFTCC